jgi:RNA polymerase sigma factor (sigma-70 family)
VETAPADYNLRVRSDDDLLEAWRAGDKRAGKELFERYYDAIDRFFRNKVGEDATDLAQKTFLGCLESVDRYRNQQNFRGWLFAIAYRQLCKHYRSCASDMARFDFGVVTAFDLDPTPTSIIARSQDEQLLLEALRKIPVDMQVALELHYWEQMSDAEIATTLELPLGTVKSRIRRARVALTERLGELTQSPEQLRSTLDNLEAWAAQVRGRALPT